MDDNDTIINEEAKYKQLIEDYRSSLKEYDFSKCQKTLKQAISINPVPEALQLIKDFEKIKLDENFFVKEYEKYLKDTKSNTITINRLKKLYSSLEYKSFKKTTLGDLVYTKINSFFVNGLRQDSTIELIELLKLNKVIITDQEPYALEMLRCFNVDLVETKDVGLIDSLLNFLIKLIEHEISTKTRNKIDLVTEVILYYLEKLSTLKQGYLTLEKNILNYYNTIKHNEQVVLETIYKEKYEKTVAHLIETESYAIKVIFKEYLKTEKIKNSIYNVIEHKLTQLARSDNTYKDALYFINSLIKIDNNFIEIFYRSNILVEVIDYLDCIKDIDRNKDNKYLIQMVDLILNLILAIVKNPGTDNSQVTDHLDFISKQTDSDNIETFTKACLIVLKLNSNKSMEREIRYSNLYNKLCLFCKKYHENINKDLIIFIAECFYYYSAQGYFKEKICLDESLLDFIFDSNISLKDEINTSYYKFITLNIFSNLTSFLTPLTQEEQNIRNLKKTAQKSKDDSFILYDPYDDQYNKESKVKIRIKNLLNVDNIFNLVVEMSSGSKDSRLWKTISQIYNNLSNEKASCSRILQNGFIRYALEYTNKHLVSKSMYDETDTSILMDTLQFFARTGIYNDPSLCFPKQTIHDIILLMLYLIICPNKSNGIHYEVYTKSNKIIQFEALMCLTNIASLRNEVAEYIFFRSAKLLSDEKKDEISSNGFNICLINLMLDQNEMIQRAATQLYCNLSASQSKHGILANIIQHQKTGVDQLHILVALMDVDDSDTRLAAGGALALLTGYTEISKIIFSTFDKEKNIVKLFNKVFVSNSRHTNNDQMLHRLLIILINLTTFMYNHKIVKTKEDTNTYFGDEMMSFINSISKSNNKHSKVVHELALEFKRTH